MSRNCVPVTLLSNVRGFVSHLSILRSPPTPTATAPQPLAPPPHPFLSPSPQPSHATLLFACAAMPAPLSDPCAPPCKGSLTSPCVMNRQMPWVGPASWAMGLGVPGALLSEEDKSKEQQRTKDRRLFFNLATALSSSSRCCLSPTSVPLILILLLLLPNLDHYSPS